MPISAAECQRLLESCSAAEIAHHLRQDQELCREGRLPSVLAHYLPPASSPLGRAISSHLLPDAECHGPALGSLRLLQYDSIIRGIKAFSSQMDEVRSMKQPDEPKMTQLPSIADFQTALNVLEFLSSESKIAGLMRNSTLDDVIVAVRTQLQIDPALRTSLSASQGNKRKKCYICRFCTQTPHHLYRSLCAPCGAFNLAGSELSLPENLDLRGSTALVTGGRINLGYHIALRLLRCGSSVIVSSRYPRDAAKRYHSEADSDQWVDRLKIVGADFRAAKDAFRLVVVVRKLLSEWPDGSRPRKLNILVNNAAQTLTDPIQSESKAVSREHFLRDDSVNGRLLVHGDRGYDAKVRGGMQLTWVAGLQEFGQLKLEDSTYEGSWS